MDFRIRGLDPGPFAPLFRLSDDELRERGSIRRIAQPGSIFPCRISQQDAAPGEEVILTNYTHLPVESSPYRSTGPIYVRRAATETWDRINQVPDILLKRPLSVRAYDGQHLMVDAAVTTGRELAAMVERFFSRNDIRYLHIHNAGHGCYQCRVDRV
jgi:Protein of unknown function (DUF1203)